MRAALIVAGAAAAAALAGLGLLAWTNADRADRWQQRAVALEATVEALNEVVAARSGELNARTRELNLMAEKVGEATAALEASEADVSSLAERQRQLAAEKAEVEDERALVAAQAELLQRVASTTLLCKNGLIELLNALAREDDAAAQARWGAVSASCDRAEAELEAYRERGR